MIISQSKKFIFVHNPKAAGTSIQQALLPWDDGKHLKARTKHETLTELRNRTTLDLSTFIIFGFVRNPWDRFSSFFCFLKKHSDQFPQIKSVKDVNQLALCVDQPWLRDKYTTKLQAQYFDDTVNIGKYENLQHDFKNISAEIGIDVKLPHANASYTHDYKKLFNKESKQIIAKRYAQDIKRFNYEF